MTGLACPACSEACSTSDAFCEACGANLGAPPQPVGTQSTTVVTPVPAPQGCVRCGGPVDASAFCTECGHRQPSTHDHAETDLGPVAAAVTDRGRSHHRNEDAYSLGTTADGSIVAIVCDGVSTAARSDEAARAATAAALDVARRELDSGGTAADALRRGASAAQAAVVALSTDADVPSCTYAAAVVTATTVTFGCVGDSRVYLLPPGWDVSDPVATDSLAAAMSRLTTDDSWAAETVAAGDMDEVSAMADPRAHHITRWIGRDTPSFEATVGTVDPAPGAAVLVCSDGLWNELPSSTDLMNAVLAADRSSPSSLARRLVDAANDLGGRDNITVVVVPVPSDHPPTHPGGERPA